MRVLLVEDNAVIALDLAEIVRDHDAEPVGPVASVAEALAQIARTKVDGAILDIHLGGEDSSAIADELKRRHIPFAFATGYDPSDSLPSGHAHVPVIAKPYSAADVRAILSVLRARSR